MIVIIMIAVILLVYTIIFHIIVKFSLKTNRPDKIRQTKSELSFSFIVY